MKATDTIKRGDTIQLSDGTKAVVVKIGRGTVRSAFVYKEDGTSKLITEVDWWQAQGTIRLVGRKKKNLEFAKRYCEEFVVPDL